MAKPLEQVTKACSRLGIKPTERILVVRLGSQTLQYFADGSLAASYAVSTSRRDPSNIKGSLGTPRGLHRIVERIGGGQPAGAVFKARMPTGRHFSEMPASEQEGNLITSRILWLEGVEPGVNLGGEVDTQRRYIYIHGTNHEDRIGSRISAGCVLMRNADVITLYDVVRAGDLVWISD
jgi:hypothetical protein